ncbi:MAG: D-TA family PLP-dependent enzyme [Verrucomicrobia bacterium]|nr:D-TA family PLP-dependent enzyme [Verrucomicrobiota bacterium]
MEDPSTDWFSIQNADELSSPALLVYPDRVRNNIKRMLQRVDNDPARLCPHVKTIKTEALIRMMVNEGITQFKCATIAEGETALKAGALSVLLAVQPSKPVAERWITLAKAYPDRSLSTVVDCLESLQMLGQLAGDQQAAFNLYLDLNVGMNRTGITPGPAALELVDSIQSAEGLNFNGLHAYDGHLHQPDIKERQEACDDWHRSLRAFADQVKQHTGTPPRIIAGGTPTFPMHAATSDLICSPGTCVLWDAGYAHHFKDLDFLWALVVMCRVISKPTPNTLCLDLGHKAIASEMSPPRIAFFNLEAGSFVSHSEEHLVVSSPQASRLKVGSILYGVPWHVCPTVALHQQLHVVENHQATSTWEVVARNRTINY